MQLCLQSLNALSDGRPRQETGEGSIIIKAASWAALELKVLHTRCGQYQKISSEVGAEWLSFISALPVSVSSGC